MTSRRSILLSLMLGAFLSVMGLQTANAQVPRSISYQGRLIKAGQPVNGTVNLTIKIYDASGAEKYTESYGLVEVKDGIFNVLLGGTGGTLPGSLDFNEQYFLGINVDGTGEMNPRTPFVASPYALNAELVGGVGVAKVPTPGKLLPLDENGKLPISVLPQTPSAYTINGIALDDSLDLKIIGDAPITVTNMAAQREIHIGIDMNALGNITAVQSGPGLTGGGSTGVVTLQVADNGIITSMIGTGAVTGMKIHQLVAGDGIYQDVLGNLNVGVNSTLLAFPDYIALNLANPNTWTALQTFNAGITVNGTTILNGPVNITGLITHVGNTNQTGNYNLTGNLVVTGTSDLQGNIFNSSLNNGGSVSILDNFLVTGNSNFIGDITHTGNHTQVGNWTGTGTWTHTGNMSNTGNFTQTGDITNTGNLSNTGSAAFFVAPSDNVSIFGTPEPNAVNPGALVTPWDLLNDGDLLVTGYTYLIGNTWFDGTSNTMTGALNVNGLSTLTGVVNNGTLTQNGASTFTGAITQSGGNVTLGGATTINNTLNVNGATTLNGNLTVTGLSDLQGAISNSTANNSGDVTVNDGFRVNGNTTQNGSFTQTSGSTSLLNTTITGTLTQSGGNATINGGAANVFGSVAGSANTIGGVGSNNTLTGATNTITSSGNTTVTTGGNLALTTAGNNNISGVNNNITGTLNTITGNTQINGNLTTTGNNTLGTAGVSTNLLQGVNNTMTSSVTSTINGVNVNINGLTTINGNTQINGTLGTTGNMNLGTASTVNNFGGPAAANRFNGTSNFGSLPAGNGNKVIVDGVPNNNPINIIPCPGF